jgi:hypothetical protein
MGYSFATTVTAAALAAFVWSNNVTGAFAGIGCPCVQDLVTFKFDLSLGCVKGNIVNPSDFTRTSCTVIDSSNSRVKKVVIHDHQSAATTTTLPVFLSSSAGVEAEDASTGDVGAVSASSSYYYFQYQRSDASPSVLFMDLFSSSNTLMASVDLYFATSNRNCVVSSSPIFWPGDTLYFLTAVRCCGCGQKKRTVYYGLLLLLFSEFSRLVIDPARTVTYYADECAGNQRPDVPLSSCGRSGRSRRGVRRGLPRRPKGLGKTFCVEIRNYD